MQSISYNFIGLIWPKVICVWLHLAPEPGVRMPAASYLTQASLAEWLSTLLLFLAMTFWAMCVSVRFETVTLYQIHNCTNTRKTQDYSQNIIKYDKVGACQILLVAIRTTHQWPLRARYFNKWVAGFFLRQGKVVYHNTVNNHND